MENDFLSEINEYMLHGFDLLCISELYGISESTIFHHALSIHELEKLVSLVERNKRPTKTLGQFINEALFKLEMTQQDLANKSGFSKGYISHVINGRTNPSKYKLLRMAFAMTLTVEETKELLLTRGYTFSNSIKDRIIVSCLEIGIYDLLKVEEALNKIANAGETLYEE
ncbi:helix-turn-helix transcriptional regulator [Bacillus sp. CGMCC 1.16541]|uniref:helix-turn-helix domain-containing protein n=1 Tax=Bacillus sp. CGMCC 1.16541 TaxID=2185143 RepID=UPI000D73D44A|nr:helix-turn-helix transcriptional regulator [Bacillus sp. CGMCC 1.16541]